MKMLHLGCKTIKDGITTAIIFLLTGACIVLAGIWVVPEFFYFSHITIFMGAIILLMAPVILVASYLKNR